MSEKPTRPEPELLPSPPSDEELEAWERIASAATPGPWEAEDSKYDWVVTQAQGFSNIAKVFETRYDDDGNPTTDNGPGKVNADFIAALHPGNALRLIAEVNRSWDEIAELRGDLFEARVGLEIRDDIIKRLEAKVEDARCALRLIDPRPLTEQEKAFAHALDLTGVAEMLEGEQ